MNNNPKVIQYNFTEGVCEVRRIKEIELECHLSAWSESDYTDEQLRKDSIFLLAKVNDKFVGFLVARVFEGEADLLNFGVLSRFRVRGIGKMLFGRLILEAAKREVKSVWLEVRKSNETAVKFYLRQNFYIIQTRKEFYSNPTDDALLMKFQMPAKKP